MSGAAVVTERAPIITRKATECSRRPDIPNCLQDGRPGSSGQQKNGAGNERRAANGKCAVLPRDLSTTLAEGNAMHVLRFSCPDWEKPVMTGDSCPNQTRAQQTRSANLLTARVTEEKEEFLRVTEGKEEFLQMTLWMIQRPDCSRMKDQAFVRRSQPV
ncbi:hypothetical protein Bbelb_266480 [Branchiostoma belcheri]|nr:hypothetical protein Bbelb_266480 [Branchiostoma belcheri]